MTYNELVTAIQDYCETTFATADINTFITQAEQRIYNTVQISNLRKNVTGLLSISNQYLACPGDFLSAYSIAIYPVSGGEYIFLLNKDVNFIREAYPNPATTGVPKHYALFGPQSGDVNELTFIVGPTPSSATLCYSFLPTHIRNCSFTFQTCTYRTSPMLKFKMCENQSYYFRLFKTS